MIEEDGVFAEVCVVLELTAPVTVLGCDATVTLEVLPGTDTSKPSSYTLSMCIMLISRAR